MTLADEDTRSILADNADGATEGINVRKSYVEKKKLSGAAKSSGAVWWSNPVSCESGYWQFET